MSTSRRASVPCFAKLNLDLRVLGKRPDGYHEVRTIYQTVSLRDELEIEFRRARSIDIDLESSIDIDDNIILKAARAVLEYMDVTAHVRFALKKNIPMGAGLGGGSSNAAAILIALPALARKRLSIPELQRLGSWLGSDVPFFLFGGTALGLGRGTELYPLPDLPAYQALVVPSDVHVSTAEAYRDLQRPALQPDDENGVTDSLTSQDGSLILGEFQAVAWLLDRRPLDQTPLFNDFEPVVFAKHPQLGDILRKLKRLGANPARMTGSGSALFGVWPTATKAKESARQFSGAVPVKFVRRAEYRERWKNALGDAAGYSTLFE